MRTDQIEAYNRAALAFAEITRTTILHLNSQVAMLEKQLPTTLMMASPDVQLFDPAQPDEAPIPKILTRASVVHAEDAA
jgi:hypothetical protein